MTIDKQPSRPAQGRPGRANGSAEAVGGAVSEQTVGERLRTAREAKGLDYYRVERDTKIRAKYLAALEGGDYAVLPGDVYSKGFLRNYALYLGLNDEEMVEAWRHERAEAISRGEAVAGPEPLLMPRRRFILMPNHFFMVLLAIVVGAFGFYFVLQVSRLMQPITLSVSDPSAGRIDVDVTTTTYVLSGTATANVTVEISWDGQPAARIRADSTGHWTYVASLHAGINQFEITARDAGTQHHSDTVVRLINVAVSGSSPGIPQLVLTSPVDGSTAPNDTIEVAGSSVLVISVKITTICLGPPPAPGATAPAPTPTPTPRPSPSESGAPEPSPSPTAPPSPTPGLSAGPTASPNPNPPGCPAGSGLPSSTSKTVDKRGDFGFPVQLQPGRWLVTVTGISDQGQESVPLRSVVTVLYSDVHVVVRITGGPIGVGKTTLAAWKNDGKGLVLIAKAKKYGAGTVLTFDGVQAVQLQTDCAAATKVTVNGWSYSLGSRCNVVYTWLLTATRPPRRV
jgi:cytoskeletal protein RodZ